MRGLTDPQSQAVFDLAHKFEPRTRVINEAKELRQLLSPSGKAVVGAKAVQVKAYYNPQGGWIDASGAISKLYKEIHRLGGKLAPGNELESLILTEDGNDVRGVRCVGGREFIADKIILAFGSWTGGHPALKGIFPDGMLVPTGQTIAGVHLNEEEQERYKDMPVIANLDGSGYYMFPVSSHPRLWLTCAAQPDGCGQVRAPWQRVHCAKLDPPDGCRPKGCTVHRGEARRLDPQTVVQEHAREVWRAIP